MSTEKINVQLESGELSYIWGKKEDSSHGDHLSNSSEKLLHRSKEAFGMYAILVKENTCNQHLWWTVAASPRKVAAHRCLFNDCPFLEGARYKKLYT